MKTNYSITFFLLLFFSNTNGQPIAFDSENIITKSTSFRSNTIDCGRSDIIDSYQNDYLGSSVSTLELGWTGNVDNCITGEISGLAMERTLQRINYFRNLVGIEQEVIFSEVKNQKCQKAVLMMDAEKMLDHYPTTDWKCSSSEGIEAAGKSNLSYGGHSSASVPQYIRDAGSGNGAAGHRRWILFPKSYEFGFGSTNWGTAMWVIGGTKNPDIYPEFVAYPSPGYFPKKGANYSDAIIRMYDELGQNIDFTLEENANGYGDNTLVWVPQINLNNSELGTDVHFKVVIDSVKSGAEYERFEYEVLGIATEGNSVIITQQNPECDKPSGSINLDVVTGYKSILWSNGIENSESLSDLSAGIYSVTITDKIGCDNILDFELSDVNAPKLLTGIAGNSSSHPGQTELYGTQQHVDGQFVWNITNGENINQDSNSEIEVRWNDNATEGQVCVYFEDFNGCISNEVCVEVELNTSNVLDQTLMKTSIHPNPVSRLLNIDFPIGMVPQTLSIYNSNGALEQKTMIVANSEKLFLDVEQLKAGLYFLRLDFGGYIRCEKFIKL